MVPTTSETVHPAAAIMRTELPTLPTVALVCGSGFLQALQSFPLVVWNVADLPSMPAVTVQGHGRTVELHVIHDVPTLVFTGRYHLYEGHSDDAAMTNLDIAHSLGVSKVVLTNASGGIHPRIARGDVMLIQDVMDATSRPMPPVARSSKRSPIDPEAVKHVASALTHEHLAYCLGTYAQVLGPTYETRAEVRMLRRMGADVVGMSTAREALYASSLGISVVALSLVTNVASDVQTPVVDHHDVLDLAMERSSHVCAIIESTVRAVGTA